MYNRDNLTLPGAENISANISSCIKNDGFKYPLYSTIFSIVFVVGLITNVVAIYIFMCSLKLRNETTTYMMNLVVSDLLFVFTLPLRVFYFINQNWPFGSMLCKVSVSLFYTNMYGSMLFLTCISVDRFLAIVHPFRSRALRTKRNARIVCIAVWVLVLSGSLPTGFMLETTSPEKRQTNATFCFENFSSKQWKSHLSKVVIFIETVGFIIPLLLNVCCSIMVLQTLRRPQTISRGGGKLNKTKILRMIIVHLLIFCFCFIPYNVNLVFYALVRTKTLKGCFVESVVRTIYPIALCIAVSNCCFDPIVYYFTSETIQNSIKRKSQVSRSYDAKFSEALQSETSSNLQCSLKNIKAKVFHNESSV
ncbi:Lysophosphatidic acid receptor 6 [Larimichthys crocea]|uniref:Lysophosphatidic acid receptor 6 n=2 Tax=Larimichthys crocea TaxID=215358 RepID=A0A6G0IUV5_LARCR|nr:lysophosphatidic acid receptor 6 [Larimichthys crocea]KAE8295117.1 Lysophosphatidic acid receptor 6 [Larimichthys crocea]